MAIEKLTKLTLIGTKDRQEDIFDALIGTQMVHVAQCQEIDNCQVVADNDRLQNTLTLSTRVEEAISYVKETVDAVNDKNKKVKGYKTIEFPKPDFARPLREMSYGSFADSGKSLSQTVNIVETIENEKQSIASHNTQLAKITSEIESLYLYRNLPQPINSYVDTESTYVMLGTIAKNNLLALQQIVESNELSQLTVVESNTNDSLVVVVVHKSENDVVSDILSAGFAKTNFSINEVTKQHIHQLQAAAKNTRKLIEQEMQNVCKHVDDIASLKLASDYLAVSSEKQLVSNTLPTTASTFVMQGYVPTKSVELVEGKIKDITQDVELYWEEAVGDDTPTMYRNNAVVSNFEAVIDMYSSPLYKEVDPAPVLSIFYFIIFGLMVADMGYGLLLALAGLFINLKVKQASGTKRILSLFGTCGISAIIIGALYGSFFSYPIYTGILPDAGTYPTTTMAICLMFGLTHIMAGFLIDCAYKIKTKCYGEAIFVSLMWAVFFLALIPALLQAALGFMDYPKFSSIVLPPIVGQVGLYVALGALAVAVLSSGIVGKKRSIVSRVANSLGSAYGLLNLFGDVMSYVRIFGLMLSSAMVGVVVNDMALDMMGGGVGGVVAGVVLLAFGHLFNLAIGILGVYIHNGRLQYVEFFGKFYQGDGQLFTPFGGVTKYTLFK